MIILILWIVLLGVCINRAAKGAEKKLWNDCVGWIVASTLTFYCTLSYYDGMNNLSYAALEAKYDHCVMNNEHAQKALFNLSLVMCKND